MSVRQKDYLSCRARKGGEAQSKSAGMVAYMEMAQPKPKPVYRHRSVCPACEQDPYEYVDVGIPGAMMPVAVVCCGFGVAFFSHDVHPLAKRAVMLMDSKDPRRARRGRRIAERMMNGG